jgi:uncharacterized protein (DUF2236 family)
MTVLSTIQDRLALRFKNLLSGSTDGNPPWLEVVARGDEPGHFLPTDAPWVVHRDFGTLVGGVRALLVQALHPGSLAGVMQHSRYATEPLGRLAGTIRWLTVTTFASLPEALREGSRVVRLHNSVTGEYESPVKGRVAYRADDSDLLEWVHIAFMESFLTSHEWYSHVPIPRGNRATGADNYIDQWGISVKALGSEDVPHSRAEMDARLEQIAAAGVLTVTDDTRAVIAFIRNPPLPKAFKPVYRLLYEAAVASLRPAYRQLLGLRAWPRGVIVPVGRALLRLMRFAIGPKSPIEEAAIARLVRIGVLDGH